MRPGSKFSLKLQEVTDFMLKKWSFFVATHCVQDEDRAELDEAVKRHVPEETEGRNKRTSALSAK